MERMLGIRLEEMPLASTWNDDVVMYAVHDAATQRLIGHLYFDAYARPGRKVASRDASSWMMAVRGASPTTGHTPVAAVVLNLTPPLHGIPSLLSFDQVRTLFSQVRVHSSNSSPRGVLPVMNESWVNGCNSEPTPFRRSLALNFLPPTLFNNWLMKIGLKPIDGSRHAALDDRVAVQRNRWLVQLGMGRCPGVVPILPDLVGNPFPSSYYFSFLFFITVSDDFSSDKSRKYFIRKVMFWKHLLENKFNEPDNFL